MLYREKAVRIVRESYAARMANDRKAMDQVFALDATFRLAGNADLTPDLATRGTSAVGKVDELMDLYAFESVDHRSFIVEGNHVAVHSDITLRREGVPQSIKTEFVDIWDIGDDGRVRSILQFADTAMMKRLAEEAAGR